MHLKFDLYSCYQFFVLLYVFIIHMTKSYFKAILLVSPSRVFRARHINPPISVEATSGHVVQAWAIPTTFENVNLLNSATYWNLVQNVSRKPIKQSSTEFVRWLRLLLCPLSKVRVVSPISRISSFFTMLLSYASSVLLHANSRSCTHMDYREIC